MNFLVGFLESEYASTLQKIQSLVEHEEITFALLWAILVPGEIIFAQCETTREPRLFRLKNIQQQCDWRTGAVVWHLTCQYVDAVDNPSAVGRQFGLATHELTIENFGGIQKITKLSAYPLKYHPTAALLKKKVTRRGREWANLHGVHHKHYNGLASRETERVRIDGRIMIDRG